MGALFKQYVSETLMEIVQYAKEQNEQVYFIVDANLRRYWIKELQNKEINTDILPDIVPEVLKVPNLNIIRINTGFDVPSYGVIESDDALDSIGLYTDQKGCIIALVNIHLIVVGFFNDIYLKFYHWV